MTLARDTRAFLAKLQRARACYCLRCPAITVEAAAEEGTALAEAFARAIEGGTLVDMEPNVILRELAAGRVADELRDGLVSRLESCGNGDRIREEAA